MDFPLITDWHFYAAAVPAVLLMGISKSGFGSGFGSLAVPIMALAVSVPQAAAIMMPILFVMDVMGLHAFRGHFDWKLLRFLIPLGLVGTVIGTLSFKLLDAHLVAGIRCTRGVGIFERVAEVALAPVGVPLNEQDAFGVHGGSSWFAGLCGRGFERPDLPQCAAAGPPLQALVQAAIGAGLRSMPKSPDVESQPAAKAARAGAQPVARHDAGKDRHRPAWPVRMGGTG